MSGTITEERLRELGFTNITTLPYRGRDGRAWYYVEADPSHEGHWNIDRETGVFAFHFRGALWVRLTAGYPTVLQELREVIDRYPRDEEMPVPSEEIKQISSVDIMKRVADPLDERYAGWFARVDEARIKRVREHNERLRGEQPATAAS